MTANTSMLTFMTEAAFLILEHEKEAQYVANSQINELVLTAAALLFVNGQHRSPATVSPNDTLTIKQRIAGFIINCSKILEQDVDLVFLRRSLHWSNEHMRDVIRACGIIHILNIHINLQTIQGE